MRNGRITGLAAVILMLASLPAWAAPDAAEDARLALLRSAKCINACMDEQLSPGRATRKGTNLTLTFANGKSLVLKDKLKGCADSSSDCEHFLLSADLKSRHLMLVFDSYFEGYDYLLFDDRTGRKINLGAGIPVFSPDSGRFALLIPMDPRAGTSGDIEIWLRKDDRAGVEWRYSRQRNVEDAATDWFDNRRIVWRGEDRIDFDFSGGKPLYTKLTRWQGAVARKGNAWTLLSQTPEPKK